MWNKNTFIISFFIVVGLHTYSQTITGIVLDKNTNTPIETASVYFDNTTIGTTTNSKGEFQIDNEHNIKSPLIISFIGYKKVILNTINYNKSYTILLEEENYSLDEVVVTNDDWSRALKLEEFRKHFLGTSKNAKSCTILNEDDIILRYNKQSKQLTAAAKRPLLIKNKNLQYLITYDLQEFFIEYSYVRGEEERVYRYTFSAGTSFFKKTESEDNSKIKRRRANAFKGSTLHFMRALVQQKLKDKKYQLFDGSFQTQPEKFITITPIDSLNVYLLNVIPDPEIIAHRKNNPTISFNNTVPPKSLNVLYKRNKQSIFKPNQFEFIVDKNGNHFPPNAVIFSGDLGEQRLGDTFPLDYTLEEN